MNKNKSLTKGFSIIEIMIVILIGGLIAAGAFGGWKYVQKTKENNTNSKLNALDAAIEQYNIAIGQYPTDLQELVAGPQNPQLSKKFGMPLASDSDLKDAWNKPFVYEKLAGANPPYELYSTGPKGSSKIYSPVSRAS